MNGRVFLVLVDGMVKQGATRQFLKLWNESPDPLGSAFKKVHGDTVMRHRARDRIRAAKQEGLDQITGDPSAVAKTREVAIDAYKNRRPVLYGDGEKVDPFLRSRVHEVNQFGKQQRQSAGKAREPRGRDQPRKDNMQAEGEARKQRNRFVAGVGGAAVLGGAGLVARKAMKGRVAQKTLNRNLALGGAAAGGAGIAGAATLNRKNTNE